MYTAVRGKRGTIRYVTLPLRRMAMSDGESVNNTRYEMIIGLISMVTGGSGSGDR